MGKGDDEDAEFEGTDEEHAAAAKIQARHRGKKDRKKCKDLKEKKKVRPPHGRRSRISAASSGSARAAVVHLHG